MHKSRVRLLVASVFMLLVSSLAAAVHAQPPGADDVSPVWSPDGKQIAFVSNRDGDNEIYVMNADGSALQRISASPGNDYDPEWSPDGKLLVYTSEWHDQTDVVVADAGGHYLNTLTYKNPENDERPHWSPDGKHIAFLSTHSGLTDLTVMKPDGSDLRNLTNGKMTPSYDFQWSPDSKHIAFVSQPSPDQSVQLFVTDLSGVTPSPLLDHDQFNGLGCCLSDWMWSPDSQHIIFVLPNNGSIYQVNIATGKSESLAAVGAPVNGLAWSADNQDIIYSADALDPTFSDGAGIYRVNLADGQIEPLLASFSSFIIAPDASRLLALSAKQVNAAPVEMDVFNVATLTAQKLELTPRNIFGMAWSPDSHSMAVSFCVDGDADIFRLDISDTITVTNLTPDDPRTPPDSPPYECNVNG